MYWSQKAYDTVNHGILLKKLDFYGIVDVSRNFLRSYPFNRSQFASLGAILSHENISFLGPILFNLYVNYA